MIPSFFKFSKKETEEKMPDKAAVPGTRKTMPTFLIVILLAVAVGASSAAYYFWHKTELKSNQQKTAQEEITKTIEEVGKLMVLPEGETPTIATVTDPERLRDQPFFAKAKKGDKVLIYTNAKKAILYDPVQRKIIEVAPLNIGSQQ